MADGIDMPDTTQNNPQNKLFISHITLYRSGVVLAFYLVVLEVVFLGIGVGLRLPLVFFIFSSETAITLNFVSTIANIVLIVVKLLLMITIVSQWLENYYEIRPGRVIYKSGFFSRKEQEFNCNRITKINLTQGIWGRLFNFGTISLYRETTDEWFSLSNIASPHRNLHLIQKILTNKNVEITITDEFVEEE